MIHLYYQKPPLRFKYIPGDRYIFRVLRNLVKGKKISGLDKVFINLCKGFDELSVDYTVNFPYHKIKPGEPVITLGLGQFALKGYKQPNPVIAGIGLMTHPCQWPTLPQEYPVTKYLQHSKWTMDIYVPYFGNETCDLWPSGIDTGHWSPVENVEKKIDFLVYSKFLFDKEKNGAELKRPILNKLDKLGYSYREIVYGSYIETEYHDLLQQCKAMIFLCEHESQGFACCEAMAMNVPVFAWDQGFWLDPNRFEWNNPVVPATSVPFFDERCGMTFKNFEVFEETVTSFYNKVKNGDFAPRDYVLQNLTLKKSAERMLEIVNSVYK
ncbi:glycosyltransferase [Mucilaginibacter sp.]|uniref:glycosyltransferase n=1 Tax=Mucilaginibacter sp. TaxID=1882438 RepID=UPI00374CA164